VAGTRRALIIASDNFQDAGLRQLRSPATDAKALGAVLRDPAIGDFEVQTLMNQRAHVINEAVEEFFADRKPDDLLLVHFSTHGVKDEEGELYFATANTKLGRLGATAVSAKFVCTCMNRGRSRRVVLLLDCCFAGAFARGLLARAGNEIEIKERFDGHGRIVITASKAMEYAFEAGKLVNNHKRSPSVFTSALVQGLQTGDADQDQDGYVGINELYNYIYNRVRSETPNQTPGKWEFGAEGDLWIAKRNGAPTTPAPLPAEVQQAIENPLPDERVGAVSQLAGIMRGSQAGMVLAARKALEQLVDDDSRKVSAAAAAALSPHIAPSDAQPNPAQRTTSRLRRASRASKRQRSVIIAWSSTAIALLIAIVAVIFAVTAENNIGTSYTPGGLDSTATPSGSMVWTYQAQGAVDSAVADSTLDVGSPVVADSTLYVGSNDDQVYALTATTGHVRWTYTTGGSVTPRPAVAGGSVYVGSNDHKIYALDAATGHLHWIQPTGGPVTSDLTVAGNIVYVGSNDHKLYALNATTGRVLWTYTTGDYVGSPTVAGDTVYVGSEDHKVYALDAVTGHVRWTYTTGNAITGGVAVSDNTVYVGSDQMYALNATTGHVLWTHATGAIASTPAATGGTVYVGSFDDKVYALDAATGHVRWAYTTGDVIYSDPTVSGGTVYVGSDDQSLYALNTANGHVIWTYSTSQNIDTRPAVANGMVYIGEGSEVDAIKSGT
jgi:outer membrane protein assembly factor BamB